MERRRRDIIMTGTKTCWPRVARRLTILATVALPLYTGVAQAATGSHSPIAIQSDADFSSCGCVTAGSGTASNPYLIGPWSINNVDGVAVSIDGSALTKSFTLVNLTIAGNK